MRGGGEPIEELLHVLVEQAVVVQVPAELLELLLVRQLAVDQEVGDLGEAGALAELLDRVAAVAQDAALAVDEGDRAAAGAGGAEAGIVGDGAGLAAERLDVDPDLALGAHDHRKLVVLAVEMEPGGLLRRHVVPRHMLS